MAPTTLLHALAAAILPVADAIAAAAPTYAERVRRAARLTAIVQALLALARRINPARFGAAAFAPLRPLRPTHAQPPRAAPVPGTQPPLLSARRAAVRVAALVAALHAAAAEAGHALPPGLQALCDQVETAAGCAALRIPAPRPAPRPARPEPAAAITDPVAAPPCTAPDPPH